MSTTTEPDRRGGSAWLSSGLLLAAAATMMFWSLGARYLWQDEAACAVLAERMLEHGRPLGYDGTNLITMDTTARDEWPQLDRHAGDAELAVQYYADKGDFKEDTTWTGQPWGQFILTAASFASFGSGTVTARLPFALLGVLSVLLLFRFVRGRSGDTGLAWVCALLLLGNVFWFFHVRQCRYYAPSSFFLLLSFTAWFSFREGRRFGGLQFVVASFLLFQSDFGSFFSLLGVASLDALLADRRRRIRSILVLSVVALSILPFVFQYELMGRLKTQFVPWSGRFLASVIFLNQYQLPLLLVLLLGLLLWFGRARIAARERGMVLLALAVVVVQVVWMSLVIPYPHYRYVVNVTPLSCVVVGFVLVRLWPASWNRRARGLLLAGGTLILLITPWAALPADLVLQKAHPWSPIRQKSTRRELAALALELRGDAPDPNRDVIRFLEPRLAPGDEILVNFEDTPWMFYTDARVRGGTTCFRVEDWDTPPRFVIIRRSVQIIYSEPYNRTLRRLMQRYRMQPLEVDTPDMPYGNYPGPADHYSRFVDIGPRIVVLENLGPR